MNLRRLCSVATWLLLLMPAAAWGHGIIVNVDLNAAGTKLVTDLPVYADRDITAITNIDQSLGYDQDDDVPGFDFSSNLLVRGGVISLKVIAPTHYWSPTTQLQATTTGSVVLDSLFYVALQTGGTGPIGESVAGQTSISSTRPIVLYDPSSPPGTDHHYAAYDLTTGDAQSDPPVGAYGLMVELVDTTPSGTIASSPFMIGLDNGLTHSVSSFGAEGVGNHQQPSADGTQYGAAVAAFQSQMANTVVWNVNSGGAYGAAGNWAGNPLQGSGNAGTTIILGSGSTTAINVATAVVTVGDSFTAGTLVFDNVGGTNYTLAGDGMSGHGLTLNNNGAGASVNVLGGSHSISTNLTLAERTVFNVASGASLLITGGQIGESSSGTPIYMTGGGSLTIDSVSTYSGPTTINGGSLQTTSRGSFSTGPLALNTDNYIASALQLGISQTVASLAVTGDGSGSAAVSVAAGQTLTVQQPIALEATTALQIGGNGKVRFAATSGSASVGSAATVTIASGATLELAGTVSALSSNVNVTNNSTQASGGGLVVSGTNQQAGNIDGTGDLVIESGGALTANQVDQHALVLGGTASTPALLAIAASGSGTGSASIPTDGSGNLALMNSLVPNGSFIDGTTPTGSLLTSLDDFNSGSSGSSAALSFDTIAYGRQTAVPEPSSIALAALGLAAIAVLRKRTRRIMKPLAIRAPDAHNLISGRNLLRRFD